MKICFVSEGIYSSLAKNNQIRKIGGAELQQMFIGRGLRDKGYDVSYVTRDNGQADGEIIDGLEIYKSFNLKEGLFGIRFLYPRLYKTWKALLRADADIYYVRCASYLAGILALFCRIHGRKFIFAGAHDTDFIPSQLRLPTQRDKALYKYGLRHADAIIVQSNIQRDLLWNNFHLESKVIPNFFPLEPVQIASSQKKHILWVSRIRPWKRPEQFVKLAASFPQEHFIMIGGRANLRNRSLFDKIEDMAKKIPNLKFLGFQPLEITETYFDQCKVFVNTSVYEGFPNTFLQSWRRGIPVISYVDPDNIIKKNKLGFVIDSEIDLHNALTGFLAKPEVNGAHIADYFSRNHSFKIIDKYYSIFDEVAE